MTFLKTLFIVFGAIECVIAGWRPNTILRDEKYSITVFAVNNPDGKLKDVQLVPMVYAKSSEDEKRSVLVHKSYIAALGKSGCFEFFGMPANKDSVITRLTGGVKYEGEDVWVFDVTEDAICEEFRPANFVFSTNSEADVTTDNLKNLMAAYYEVVGESAKLIVVNFGVIKESPLRPDAFSSMTQQQIPIGAPVFRNGDFVGMITARNVHGNEIVVFGGNFLEAASLDGA